MPDLGKKFECYNCGTKFYNLGRPESICPKCGANQKNAKSDEAPVAAPRPPRRTVIMEPPPEGNPDEFGEEPAPVEEEERGEDEELDEDEIVEADREEEEEF
ncbi:MAG TPA: FYDLN acid domain-containing protein [Thermoanaerobaculia bacterium]